MKSSWNWPLTSVNFKLCTQCTRRYSCKWCTAAVSLMYLMKNFVLDRRGVMCAAKAMSFSKFKSQPLFWNKPPVCLNMMQNDFSTPATQAFHNPIFFFFIILFFFLCHHTDWRPLSIIRIPYLILPYLSPLNVSLCPGVLNKFLYGEAGVPLLYNFQWQMVSLSDT